jgi:hypothetical protein
MGRPRPGIEERMAEERKSEARREQAAADRAADEFAERALEAVLTRAPDGLEVLDELEKKPRSQTPR